MAEKQREDLNNQEEIGDRYYKRKEFWTQFLKEMNKQTDLGVNVSPTTAQWIPISLGIAAISINLVISQKYARAEIYINRGTREDNKKVFDFFLDKKKEIETAFGDHLVWERMDDKVTSRIKFQMNEVNAYDSEYWPKINPFLFDATLRLEKAFKEPVEKLRSIL